MTRAVVKYGIEVVGKHAAFTSEPGGGELGQLITVVRVVIETAAKPELLLGRIVAISCVEVEPVRLIASGTEANARLTMLFKSVPTIVIMELLKVSMLEEGKIYCN